MVKSSVNCDQQALETYQGALDSGRSQSEANEVFSNEYWSCLDEGGMSEPTVYVGF